MRIYNKPTKIVIYIGIIFSLIMIPISILYGEFLLAFIYFYSIILLLVARYTAISVDKKEKENDEDY